MTARSNNSKERACRAEREPGAEAKGRKKRGCRKNVKGHECGGTIEKYRNVGDTDK